MTANAEGPDTIDRLKKPVLKAIGIGILATGTVIAIIGNGGGSSETLRAATTRLLDENTRCYDLGDHPVLTPGIKTVGGIKRRLIEVTMNDSSIHEPGQDSWASPNDNQYVSLQQTGFRADYSELGNRRLAVPLHEEIHPQTGRKPTTPTSTQYNLELSVNTATQGERVTQIFYKADTVLGSKSNSTTVTGERLCGELSFMVGPSGDVSQLQTLEPTEEVGKLRIVGNLAFPAHR
jgi:hypothetical protein